MCWILHTVLGINPETIKLDGFKVTNPTYETFMFDQNGKRRYWDTHEAATLDVAWTPEQRKLLREWWDFIPPQFKGELID